MTQASLAFPDEPAQHDPGGMRLIPLPPDVVGRAVFGGPAHCYRYLLERVWAAEQLTALVVMMNPSTADPQFDDPTIAKLTRMARRWAWQGVPGAFGRLLVGNTFAYRATHQARLAEVADPVGPENYDWLRDMAAQAAVVIFAYGTPKLTPLREQGPRVVRALRILGVAPHVLRLSGSGIPWHPLYLPDATAPAPWPQA